MGVASFSTVYLFCACVSALTSAQDWLLIGGVWLLFFVFALLILVGPAFWRARGSEIVLDEGGVRIRSRALRLYVTYNLLGGADLEKSMGRLHFRLLDRNSRPLVLIPVLGIPKALLTRMIAEVARRVESGLRRVELPLRIQRQGRRLGEWVVSLQQEQARGKGSYRSDEVDLIQARKELADETVHPEDRAALAVLLLNQGAQEEAFVGSVLGPASPPVLVGMIQQRKPELVPPPLLAAVHPFLVDEL
ncbi:MAG: hypothetical protein RMJ98_11040 [Myxococcales bacterium]|nr:hypothetical protein [Polyangiaceae bacterium]MDW8249822.1 hypothetical protein [Myxococcales bacterium]